MTPEIIEINVFAGPSIIEIEVPGIAGPQGPAGLSTIGGYGVNFNNLEAGDLLRFSGQNWGNENKIEITDGGNY